MNKVVMVGVAKSGKSREALAGLKAILAYVDSKYGVKPELYMQIFGGTVGTVYVMTDYKDLASAQAALAKGMADDKYMELAQKLAEVMDGPPTVALLQLV